MLTIYKASAGSGKTFTLALEYIKLLLGVKDEGATRYRLNNAKYAPDGKRISNRHRGILAITFTNKATEEMKTRIINEIDALRRMPAADGKDSPYADILTKEFGCSRCELADAANLALAQLLNDYQHFNVSTIDSFFQTVLRTFAREVDRQGDYDIELNDAYAINNGIGMMLDDMNYDAKGKFKHMSEWLSDYMERKIIDGQVFNVFNRDSNVLGNLSEYVRAISNEKFKSYADATIDYLERDPGLKKFRSKLLAYIKEQDLKASNLAADILNEWLALGFDDRALPSFPLLIDIRDNNERDIKKFEGAKIQNAEDPSRVDKFEKLYVKKYCPTIGKITQIPPDEFTYSLAAALTEIHAVFYRVGIYRKIYEACDGLEFIGYAWQYIDKFRKENNLILLSDTNDLISRIISDSEMPFIYERLGVTLTNFLIDEFQDTSHLQWRNLFPLVSNSVADGNDSLIIGDEKQAIYRFRNSDSSLLHYKVANEYFAPDKRVIKGDAPGENSNYRSAPNLVRFNNSVFRKIARAIEADTYDNVAQSIPSKNEGKTAYITIREVNHLQELNGKNSAFEGTALEIKRQYEAGYRWSDIAVLVRTRNEAADIIGYLMAYHPDIKLASNEALLLTNSKAVRLIVSLLKLLDVSYTEDNAASKDKETDDKPKYGTMQDNLMFISRFEYNMGNMNPKVAPDVDLVEGALLSALNPDEFSTEAIRKEVNEIRRQNPSNLIALVETIIELRIPQEQRQREFAYISAFQDLVINYCTKFNPSVHAFIEWWDENKDQLAVTASAESDAVTVMTIHKAKGLEWDCVHIPFASWDLVKNASIWVETDNIPFLSEDERPPVLYIAYNKLLDAEESPICQQMLEDRREQLIDNINGAYVALTRPRRELSIYYDSKATGEKFNKLLEIALTTPDEQFGDSNIDNLYMPINRMYDADTCSFTFGEPTIPDAEKAEPKSVSLRPVPTYAVFHRADTAHLTSVEDATSLDATLDIGNDEVKNPIDEEEQSSLRAQRGLWLHYVLADMRDYKDLERALRLKRARTPIDDDTFEDYRRVLIKAFDSVPQYRDRWFVNHSRALTESSIYELESDKVLRPDRIVFTEDGGIEIVDYKFTAQITDKHKEQVAEYIEILTEMGYANVTGYLWYPEKGQVIPVTPLATHSLFD